MNTFDPQGLVIPTDAEFYNFKHQWVFYIGKKIIVINKVMK